MNRVDTYLAKPFEDKLISIEMEAKFANVITKLCIDNEFIHTWNAYFGSLYGTYWDVL